MCKIFRAFNKSSCNIFAKREQLNYYLIKDRDKQSNAPKTVEIFWILHGLDSMLVALT